MTIWQILSHKVVLTPVQYTIYKSRMGSATQAAILVGIAIGVTSGILYPFNLVGLAVALVLSFVIGALISLATHVATIKYFMA